MLQKLQIFSLILIGFFTNQVNSAEKMIITNGERGPRHSVDSQQLSWENCLEYCLHNGPCVGAYQVDETNCEISVLGFFPSIAWNATGNKVAFKITSSSCPVENTEPMNYIVDQSVDTAYASMSVSYNYNNNTWLFVHTLKQF